MALDNLRYSVRRIKLSCSVLCGMIKEIQHLHCTQRERQERREATLVIHADTRTPREMQPNAFLSQGCGVNTESEIVKMPACMQLENNVYEYAIQRTQWAALDTS